MFHGQLVDAELNEHFQKENKEKADIWLDSYSPNKYFELLTEEKDNLKLLKWMKSWERSVFSKKKNKYVPDEEFNCDKHKVVLIGGSPGLGKSTMARVIARHCGYEPLVVSL